MIFDSHVEQGRKSKQLEPLQLLLAFVYAFDLFAPVHGKWALTKTFIFNWPAVPVRETNANKCSPEACSDSQILCLMNGGVPPVRGIHHFWRGPPPTVSIGPVFESGVNLRE